MKKNDRMHSLLFKRGEGIQRPLKDLSFEELLALLSCSWKQAPGEHLQLRQMALDELWQYRADRKLEDYPLQKGSQLTIIGQSAFKARELKERLAAFGIKLSNRLNDKTTHILLGLNPSTNKGLEHWDGELCFIKDLELQAALDALEQPYLQEADAQTASNVEHIGNLLVSNNPDNIKLAIQIIEGGGFPKELIPHAFIAMKITGDSEIYQSIKGILDKYLGASAKKSIRRTLALHPDMREDKLTKNLRKYTEGIEDLDGVAIAQLLHQHYGKGSQFIWKYSNDEKLNKQLIEHYLNENTLDLSSKGLTILPAELSNYPSITKVILKDNNFKSVPKILIELPDLEYLDISLNFQLLGVSPALTKMKNLTHLNYYGDMLYWDSYEQKKWGKMKQLQQVILRDMAPFFDKAQGNAYKKMLAELLPNTKIIYKP